MQGAAARPGLSVARGAGANVDAAGRAASTHSAGSHARHIADRVEGIRRSFHKYKILYSYKICMDLRTLDAEKKKNCTTN